MFAANDGGLRGVAVRQGNDWDREFSSGELQLSEVAGRPPASHTAYEPGMVVGNALSPLHAHEAGIRALQEMFQRVAIPLQTLNTFHDARRAVVGETRTQLD